MPGLSIQAPVMVVPALVALVLGLLLPFFVKPLLHRWNLVDIPTARSSHVEPVFRGMGLATAVAAMAGFVVALVSGLIPSDRSVALAVLFGMVTSGFLGWMEDFRGVSIRVRFLVQWLIGLVVSVAITFALHTSIWWIPLGVFAVAAYINVVNFMDGVNGISGLHGLVVGGFYSYAGWISGLPWLVAAGAAVAFAYVAFLPWNIRTGKNVFLGDAGSYFLGGAIASMAVGAFLSGVYVEYILSPVMIYLADTGFTLLRRMARGEQWYKPHRTHVYQRLTDVGLSHVGSSLVVACFTVLISLIAVVALPYETQDALGAGLLVLALVALYLSLPALIRRFSKKHS